MTTDAAAVTTPAAGNYPVRYSVDYPEGPRNRFTVLIRLILAIPILFVLAVIESVSIDPELFAPLTAAWLIAVSVSIGAVSWLTGATVLMILFRRKYPRWWFDFSIELARFGARVMAYVFVLRDEYPSTDETRRFTWRSTTRTRRRSTAGCRS